MAATTHTDLTDAQKKLLDDYDPAMSKASLSGIIQDIIDTLNAHADEIDAKADVVT